MTKPRYTGLQKEQVPTIRLDEGRALANLIAGHWDGHWDGQGDGQGDSRVGPIETLLDITMSTIASSAGAELKLSVPAARNIFLYVVRGALTINAQTIEPQHLVEFANDGERIDIAAQSDAFVLFGHAEPLGEPVVAHGPFVMNTREEITRAIRDYQAGKFHRAFVLE